MSKVSNEKLVLHLPFDEEVGSAVAYNYAPNRTSSNDAVIGTGCSFTEDAMLGNALKLSSADAECSVAENVVDLSGEFTIAGFAKCPESQIRFLMDYDGGNTQQLHTAQVSPSQWHFLTIQRVLMNAIYYTRFIVDTNIVYNEPSLGVPMFCSVSCNESSNEPVIIDDVRAYNRALTLMEVFTLQKECDHLDFLVDGVNFKEFGVEVSETHGLLGGLERKAPLRVDWDSLHGEVVDLSRPHWNARQISLECFIVASTNTAFIRSMNRFLKAFNKAGTQRLTCIYADSVKPLEYDVYRNDEIEVDYTWSDELKVGTFTIALIEPQPIKIVLKHICQSSGDAWFQCNSDKPLLVTWGDNTTNCAISTDGGSTWDTTSRKALNSSNLKGTPVRVKHTYAAAGDYDIVIHGNMESISNLTTNCIVVYGADGNI